MLKVLAGALLVGCLLATEAGGSGADIGFRFEEPVTANRYIEAMVGGVSGDTLWKYVAQLSGCQPVVIGSKLDTLLTRYSYSWRIDHAAEYLREQLERSGIQVTFDPYVVGEAAFYSLSFPNPYNGWTVGNDQAVYRTRDGGLSWERQAIDAPYHSFWGICFIDESLGWICGTGGNVFHTRDGGGTWSKQPVPTGMTLRDICFVDSLNGWIAGFGGAIVRTTDGGLHWAEVESGTTADLLGLAFRSPVRGWACGEDGVVLFWDGIRWTLQPTGSDGYLMDVDFGNDDSGWAVGRGPTILRTEDGGRSWVQQAAPDSINPFLNGVASVSPSEGWIVGLNGTILHTDDAGETWHTQEGRTLFGLNRVRFPRAQEGWVAGYGSTVLHTADGGATWQSQRENLPSEALRNLKNVVATKPGRSSDGQVIICGHFDSISEDPYTRAPGADDNATGTAAVMEAARIMADYDFERTIKFICFSGEEQGLFGSGEYVTDAQLAGDSIVAVLNFDMIGYADVAPEDIDIVGNAPSEWLVDLAVDCAGVYVPSLEAKKIIDPNMVYSDHASFWRAGYAAVLGIEDIDIVYPYYHTTGDTLGNISRSFFTDAVRMGISVMAHLACPDTAASGPGLPAGIRILAAHPNPFSMESGIRLATAASGIVEVAVTDVRGRRVKTLINTHLPAGRHVATWHGRDEQGVAVAPGVYFVEASLGKDRDDVKIVLLR